MKFYNKILLFFGLKTEKDFRNQQREILERNQQLEKIIHYMKFTPHIEEGTAKWLRSNETYADLIRKNQIDVRPFGNKTEDKKSSKPMDEWELSWEKHKIIRQQNVAGPNYLHLETKQRIKNETL